MTDLILNFFSNILNIKTEGKMIILVQIIMGLILTLFIHRLSVYAHELAHCKTTKKYCKDTQYTCHIVVPFNIFSKEKPHTESEYYIYLENNRDKKEIQEIIRDIASPGYKASFFWQILAAAVAFLLFTLYGWQESLWLFAFLIVFICSDVMSYLSSGDREARKNPEKYTYKYKHKHENLRGPN